MRQMFDVSRDIRRQFPEEADYQRERKKWWAKNPIDKGTIHDLVDHIDHIARVAGIDHVGLGSDFDGVAHVPRQLEDVSCYPYITQELLNRGYTKEEIHKILGGNVLRVMRRAEATSRQD
jgi:membrane dipeptidase